MISDEEKVEEEAVEESAEEEQVEEEAYEQHYETPMMQQPIPLRERIEQLWNGEVPLILTFWGYYFGGVVVLQALAQFMTPIRDFILLGILLWTMFMIKPIVAAANNYEGPKHNALLAYVAAGVIGVALIGGFFMPNPPPEAPPQVEVGMDKPNAQPVEQGNAPPPQPTPPQPAGQAAQ